MSFPFAILANRSEIDCNRTDDSDSTINVIGNMHQDVNSVFLLLLCIIHSLVSIAPVLLSLPAALDATAQMWCLPLDKDIVRKLVSCVYLPFLALHTGGFWVFPLIFRLELLTHPKHNVEISEF